MPDARACQYAVHIGAYYTWYRDTWVLAVGYGWRLTPFVRYGLGYTSFSVFFFYIYIEKKERVYMWYKKQWPAWFYTTQQDQNGKKNRSIIRWTEHQQNQKSSEGPFSQHGTYFCSTFVASAHTASFDFREPHSSRTYILMLQKESSESDRDRTASTWATGRLPSTSGSIERSEKHHVCETLGWRRNWLVELPRVSDGESSAVVFERRCYAAPLLDMLRQQKRYVYT